MLHSKLPLGFN